MMDNHINKAEPNKWVERYSELMYQYVLPRVNDNDIAQELIQETFLSALKAINGYRGIASEKNWLFSILKNKIIDYYRKKALQRGIVAMPDLQEYDNEWFDTGGQWVEEKAPKNWQVPENIIERKEIQRIINWCKDHLKNLQQQVFTLRYMEELDSDEICKVLSITPSNYWVLIHRARLQMRSCVEKKMV